MRHMAANMAKFHYFRREPQRTLQIPSLSEQEIHLVDKEAKHAVEEDETNYNHCETDNLRSQFSEIFKQSTQYNSHQRFQLCSL